MLRSLHEAHSIALIQGRGARVLKHLQVRLRKNLLVRFIWPRASGVQCMWLLPACRALVCRAVSGVRKKGCIGRLPLQAWLAAIFVCKGRRMGPEHLSLDDQGHGKNRSMATLTGMGEKMGSGGAHPFLLGLTSLMRVGRNALAEIRNVRVSTL